MGPPSYESGIKGSSLCSFYCFLTGLCHSTPVRDLICDFEQVGSDILQRQPCAPSSFLSLLMAFPILSHPTPNASSLRMVWKSSLPSTIFNALTLLTNGHVNDYFLCLQTEQLLSDLREISPENLLIIICASVVSSELKI